MKPVWLFASGMKVSEIAEIADKCRRIVYDWISCYLQNYQADSLKDADKTGRPASASGITDKRIMTELKHKPLKPGYASSVWTFALLVQHLASATTVTFILLHYESR